MNRKVKRMKIFIRVLSGLKLRKYEGARVRFLSLTLNDWYSDWEVRDKFDFLQYSKRMLYQEVVRDFGFRPIDFCVKTDEGNGVLHILYEGQPLERGWILDKWNGLTGSQIFDIRELDLGQCENESWYVASQYMASQKCRNIRYSMSSRWLWKGWQDDYALLRCMCRTDSIMSWSYGNPVYKVDKRKLVDSWDVILRSWSFDDIGDLDYDVGPVVRQIVDNFDSGINK